MTWENVLQAKNEKRGDSICKPVFYIDTMKAVMDDARCRHRMESLDDEIQLYEERQSCCPRRCSSAQRGETMNLVLVKGEEKYRRQISEMMDEWTMTGEKIIPYAIRKTDYHDFEKYLASLEVTEPQEGLVPDSTYFCFDTDRNVIVGAVNIRHCLNERLLLNGGHIGVGIRPSERKKGYATAMITLALEKCRELGIRKVLMVCDRDNVGSAKSIINNGGILENEIVVDGVAEQRYWINIM